jgi:hypothetical protein
MISSDRGLQFTSNLWFQLCEILKISHKQTTAYHPESNGAVKRLHRRLKDTLRACTAAATWSEELPFVLLGLRAQLREDTGLYPVEEVFDAQIVLPNEFLQNDELSVDTIVKKFSKTLHDSAPSLPRQNSSTDLPGTCQPSCSPPPSSGSVGVAWFHPFSRQPLRGSALQPPLLHHQSRVAGQGGYREPSQGLHGRERHAWQPASLRQTAGFAPRQSCRNQAGLVFRPAGFFTFTSGAATRRSWNCFPTRR